MVSLVAHSYELINSNGNHFHVNGYLNNVSYKSKDKSQIKNYSFIHYNLKAKTKILGKLKGFGLWDQKIKILNKRSENDHDITKNNTIGFAGFSLKNIGSIDYGRNYGIMHDVSVLTNVAPIFGGESIISDNFFSGPSNGLTTYRNKDFFGMVKGLNFAIQHQNESDQHNNQGEIRDSHGEGYGVSTSYDFGQGLYAAIAYSNSELTESQIDLIKTNLHHEHDHNKKRSISYAIGLKYKKNNLFLSTLLSDNQYMTPFGSFKKGYIYNEHDIHGISDKYRNIEVFAKYKFDCGINPSIGYLQSKMSYDNGVSQVYTRKFISIGADVILNKKILTYMNYKLNILPENNFARNINVSVDNVLSVGIIYNL